MAMQNYEPEREVGHDAADGAARQQISDFSCGIIPHREFPTRRWLYSDDTLWYYHAPKEASLPQRIHNEDFYDTLDPCIQDLIRHLHTRGVLTTPSCQGHFYEEDHYIQVWDKLTREAEVVRGDGLTLCDDETGELFRAQAADYRLPWDSFGAFLAQATRHQTVGYVGFVLRDGVSSEVQQKLKAIEGVTVRQDQACDQQYLAHVFVSTSSMADQCRTWREVSQVMTSFI